MAERQTVSAKASQATRAAADETANTMDTVMSVNEAAMNAWRQSGEASLDVAKKLNTALMDYTNKWIDGALDAGRSIARDGTWAGALEKQTDFARTSTLQYFEESTKMLNLTADAMRNIATPWEEFYTKSVPGALGQKRNL